jgi:hypothetical protein
MNSFDIATMTATDPALLQDQQRQYAAHFVSSAD